MYICHSVSGEVQGRIHDPRDPRRVEFLKPGRRLKLSNATSQSTSFQPRPPTNSRENFEAICHASPLDCEAICLTSPLDCEAICLASPLPFTEACSSQVNANHRVTPGSTKTAVSNRGIHFSFEAGEKYRKVQDCSQPSHFAVLRPSHLQAQRAICLPFRNSLEGQSTRQDSARLCATSSFLSNYASNASLIQSPLSSPGSPSHSPAPISPYSAILPNISYWSLSEDSSEVSTDVQSKQIKQRQPQNAQINPPTDMFRNKYNTIYVNKEPRGNNGPHIDTGAGADTSTKKYQLKDHLPRENCNENVQRETTCKPGRSIFPTLLNPKRWTLSPFRREKYQPAKLERSKDIISIDEMTVDLSKDMNIRINPDKQKKENREKRQSIYTFEEFLTLYEEECGDDKC